MPRRFDLAEFVVGAVNAAALPRDGRPEIALVGRSNVGKSSLINALVRKAIARTSSTPGKTRQLNVYRVGQTVREPFYLVDLPGYGHTSGGDAARGEFAAITQAYFTARAGPSALRSPLAGCLLAVDARHPGLASDVEALGWLATLDAPSLLVTTKADKLSQAEKGRLPRACEAAFGRSPLVVSASTGEGLDELWKVIRDWTTA